MHGKFIIGLAFYLIFSAAGAQTVTRGPYLQRQGVHEITVRWRTDLASTSRVVFGDSPTSLTMVEGGSALTTEHRVILHKLAPKQRYYYAVGTSQTVLAGGDAEHTFAMPPAPFDGEPMRFWVLGDPGSVNVDSEAVTNAYLNHPGSSQTNFILTLGDTAYEVGSDAEFQVKFFDKYKPQLRKWTVWPTFGNHDGYSANSVTQTGPYFDSFSLPVDASPRGAGSGTEAYYSFDWGEAHFICMDSNGSDRSTTGPMLTWLRQDLAAADKAKWLIAYWHHPPYSLGSHNSDNPLDSEGKMIDMRERVLPILEEAGVDLVLCGHSHDYQRSYLLDRDYGYSYQFNSGYILDEGPGGPSQPYVKDVRQNKAHKGTVYVVLGSSGHLATGTPYITKYPSMKTGLNVMGSMMVTIEGDTLDSVFIDRNNAVRDEFRIVKIFPAATGADGHWLLAR